MLGSNLRQGGLYLADKHGLAIAGQDQVIDRSGHRYVNRETEDKGCHS